MDKTQGLELITQKNKAIKDSMFFFFLWGDPALKVCKSIIEIPNIFLSVLAADNDLHTIIYINYQKLKQVPSVTCQHYT